MTSGQVLAPAGRGRRPWHTAVTVAVLVAAAVLAVRLWPVLRGGAVRLAGADQDWLLLGAAATAASWPCAALALQGAVVRALPRLRLAAAQFAASAANQLLPAGVGASAVNLRFLMRCGLTAGRAASALAVKGAAACAVRVTLLVALAAVSPGLPRLSAHPGRVLLVVLLAALGAAALPAWPRCRRALAVVAADVRAVHSRPVRAAALWGGSLLFTALHVLVLIAVTRAVGLPLPAVRVALVYLAASGAAALLPTPGGLGSLDAALALALTAAGAPATAAASAILGYRLLTVWAPLLPGLVVLGVLVRRRAL